MRWSVDQTHSVKVTTQEMTREGVPRPVGSETYLTGSLALFDGAIVVLSLPSEAARQGQSRRKIQIRAVQAIVERHRSSSSSSRIQPTTESGAQAFRRLAPVPSLGQLAATDCAFKGNAYRLIDSS